MNIDLRSRLIRTLVWMLFCLALALLPALLFAQDAPAEPAPPVDSASIRDWLLSLALEHPWIASLLLIVGSLRLVVKPVLAAARWYVSGTETDRDDAWLTRVEQSPWLTTLLFLLDWLASIKIPKTKGPRADGSLYPRE